MARKNITLSLDEQLIRRAKVAAARRGLSVSALLRDQLERLAEMDERYEVARGRAMEWMTNGAALGATSHAGREQLHDRDALR